MAGQRPEFLTDLIYNSNPNIDKSATIPFDLLESTFKNLILKFTTILFTKLNYLEIFASPVTVPPYTAHNHLQLCLNLAHLHLFLSNNYQSIDYQKFAEDLKLRPKRFKIESFTQTTDLQQKYLTIQSDARFNIKLLFNVPKTLFLERFCIPSLKNSLDHFNSWFETYFPPYSRQFSSNIDKEKVRTSLRIQFRQHFILQLSKHLPESYTFQKPNSLHERREEASRVANFHCLTCENKSCEYLDDKKLHDSTKLFNDILSKSRSLFPPQDDEVWIHPTLNTTLFHKNKEHAASLDQPIPTKALDKLADQAEDFVCTQNKVKTNPKRRNYYFYCYLSLYYQTAAENHNIQSLSKEEAINLLTKNIIDTKFLAQIITYFDVVKNQKSTYLQIVKYFNDTAYPAAEKFLAKKFNLDFQPVSILDSLFLQSPF
jgi:hypothetical protein